MLYVVSCKENSYGYDEVIICTDLDQSLEKGLYSNCKTQLYPCDKKESDSSRRSRAMYLSQDKISIFCEEGFIYRPETPRIISLYFQLYPEKKFFWSTRCLYYNTENKKYYNINRAHCGASLRLPKEGEKLYQAENEAIICNNSYLCTAFGSETFPNYMVDSDRNKQDFGSKDYVDPRDIKMLS